MELGGLLGALGSVAAAAMAPKPPSPPPPPPPRPTPDEHDPAIQERRIQAEQAAMATRGRSGTNMSNDDGGNATGSFTNTSLGQ